jgi:hypothetical protein
VTSVGAARQDTAPTEIDGCELTGGRPGASGRAHVRPEGGEHAQAAPPGRRLPRVAFRFADGALDHGKASLAFVSMHLGVADSVEVVVLHVLYPVPAVVVWSLPASAH